MTGSISPWITGGSALGYLAVLFFIAYWAEDQARHSKWLGRQLKTSPLIYTLSIAVYCTSWTFFGAVGTAAKNGLEFVAIYLGPSVVFFGWLFFVRKLARISRAERITSIADFLSSRFGKSQSIGALVTIVALIATTPYIALQLKAVSQSIEVISSASAPQLQSHQADQATSDAIDASSVFALGSVDVALLVAIVIGLFTLLFGTRHLNANERHTGIVAAIAFESVVKLIAFVAVGVFVVWGLNGSPGSLLDAMATRPDLERVFTLEEAQYSRWMTLLIISAIAAICLPRQFQVTVVENEHGDHLRAASWMFPLYLFVLCLFVVPIAWTGLATLPAGSDPDMFVLTLPLANGNNGLALLAFIGGFSSATSMMIIASIVLALMLCNHIIIPVLIGFGFLDSGGSEAQLARSVLNVRRLGILVVLGLGYAYLRLTDETAALASIGLISFVGAAQFLPAIVMGVFWRNASGPAAFWAILLGTVIWAYTLLLPAIERSGVPLGLVGTDLGLLAPQGLLGQSHWDPLAHALFFSLSVNSIVLVLISLLVRPKAIESEQASRFVDVFSTGAGAPNPSTARTAPITALRDLSMRFLGKRKTRQLFERQLGGVDFQQDNLTLSASQTNSLLGQVEASLSANLGAASARVIINRLAQAQPISADEAIQILDEAQQLAAYSARLELQRKELAKTADDLAAANQQLTLIDQSKDEFLRQVSHELRTPLTSVRSFAEIMESDPDLPPERRARFLSIIRIETQRLTRMLEGILIQRRGEITHAPASRKLFDPAQVLDQCHSLVEAAIIEHGIDLDLSHSGETAQVFGNADRLQQAILNLVTNAIKFADGQAPRVQVHSSLSDGNWVLTIHDNGPGFGDQDPFDTNVPNSAGRWLGAGVGLRVTRDIVAEFSGQLKLWDDKGAWVQLSIPARG